MIDLTLEICEILPEREEFYGYVPRSSVHQGNFNGTQQGGWGNLNINQTNQTNINGNGNAVINVNSVRLWGR